MAEVDVFLTYNEDDRKVVLEIAEGLAEREVDYWSEDQLIPGQPELRTKEYAIETAKSAAVLVGSHGLNRSVDLERQACLIMFLNKDIPIIPVLLPDAGEEPELPVFLKVFVPVDMRGGLTDEALNRLASGIKSLPPPPPPPRPEPISRRCKIVFFAATPVDAPQLAISEEVHEIEGKICAATHGDQMQLIQKWAVRPDDLLQTLNKNRPRIVHFSGHGSPQDELVLLDSDRRGKPIPKDALRALFRTFQDNIRLVVLNACYSEPQAEAIVETVDVAIGMSSAIADTASIKFAGAFYQSLAFGRSVQEAFDQAKTALLVHSIPADKIPRMHVRKGVDPSQLFLVGSQT